MAKKASKKVTKKTTKKTSGKTSKKAAKPVAKVTKPDPAKVVENFLNCMASLDMDGCANLLDEHCVYQNMPFHKAIGKTNILRDMSSMDKFLTQVDVEIINVAASGNVVMNERVDVLSGDLIKLTIPLMGVFVVKDGKITEWRDYFDWTSMFGELAKASVKLPINLLRRLGK